VPNGFGVAYLTCFDGASELMGELDRRWSYDTNLNSHRLHAVHDHVADGDAK
jgi:hypothetical protein